MRKATAAALAAAAGLAAWIGFYPGDWQNWLGFSKAAYFTNGQNYAFASGVGPMLLTAIGMSTLITGLWHAHNCHEPSCWRIGKHKVNGTPWCSRHHENARPAVTTGDRLDTIITLLRELAEQNKQNARPPVRVIQPSRSRRKTGDAP